MDLKILSANMRRIRSATSMSQKALAEASGISLPSIKNIESAKNEPRVNSLQAIAGALKVNLQDLFVNVRILQTVRFRSRKQMQNRENILADIGRRLDDFNFLEEILSDEVPFKLREAGQKCSAKDVQKAARTCRQILGLKDSEPIRDICGLFEHAGIKMFSLKVVSDGFFGLSIGEKDGGHAIVVNTWDRISVERQIFSAAHELGHLMLHKDAYNVDNVDENKEEEQQADLFAGHFLMPDEGFLKEWDEASGLHPVDRVFKVKHIFHVSYKVVLKRLLEKGIVDNSIWQKFNLSYNKQYGRKLLYKEEPMGIESTEPFGLDKFLFYEDRFSKLVRLALESDKISLSRGAELLRKSISELQELIVQWKML